jgi:hypothetical protein
MKPKQQVRIDRVRAFHRDVLTLRDRVRAVEALEGQDRWRSQSGEVLLAAKEAAEELRQRLLPQTEVMQRLVERVNGKVVIQPYPFFRGQSNIWHLAFFPDHTFSQAYMLGVVADTIVTAVGLLEDDPSLLDPPPPPSAPSGTPRAPGIAPQTFHFHGASVNIGQIGSGQIDVITQSGGRPLEIGDLRRLVDDLEQAIRNLDAPEDDRKNLVGPVAELREELGKPKPRLTALMPGWNWVKTIATLDGAWGGWDRVQGIANAALPLLEALLKAAG